MLRILVLTFFLTLTSLLSAQTLAMPKRITYLEGLNPPDNLLKKCRPERMLQKSLVRKNVKGKRWSQVVPASVVQGPHFRLEVEIVDLFGLGGGAFSGAKKISVRGRLINEAGQVHSSFIAARASLGNLFVLGMQGNCDILGKVTGQLGKDIRKWLANPVDGAVLGDKKAAKEIQDLLEKGAWPPKGKLEAGTD